MVRKNRLFMICQALILLNACTTKDDISFKKDTEISVDSDISTCSLIESVNGKKITKFDLDGDRIIVGDDVIICPVLDTHKIGRRSLIFIYRNNEYLLEINIIDDVKPMIGYKSKELLLNAGDSEDDLLRKLDISDEHSSIAKALVEGEINYDEAGKYPVKIIAEDESGNVLEQKIMIIVQKEENTEKQKETIPKEETDERQQKHTEMQNETPPQQGQGNGQNHQNAVTAENRLFLFSEGYDYDSCYQASLSYAKEMVAQGKASSYTCMPVKDGKEYIGYQVIFK